MKVNKQDRSIRGRRKRVKRRNAVTEGMDRGTRGYRGRRGGALEERYKKEKLWVKRTRRRPGLKSEGLEERQKL